jgi:hypothetical protein
MCEAPRVVQQSGAPRQQQVYFFSPQLCSILVLTIVKFVRADKGNKQINKYIDMPEKKKFKHEGEEVSQWYIIVSIWY